MEIKTVLKELQTEVGVSLPISYIDYRTQHRDNSEVSKFYSAGRFIDTAKEVKRVREANELPENLLPFFVDTDAGMVGNKKTDDIYCFDLKSHPNDFMVQVFSIHTIVQSWKNFSEFIEWIGQQKTDKADN